MQIKNVVCYSFSLASQDSIAHLRLIAPLQQAGINIIPGLENGRSISRKVHEADLVILQREFPRRIVDYLEVLTIARKMKKPILFELDDLLFFLPENHPDRLKRYYAPTLLPMFQALLEADLVTVPTSKLAEALADFNRNIEVLPNFLDDHIWLLRPPVLKSSPGDILTIGYMGTHSHLPDLNYITPVLLDLIDRYPQRIRFHFWGLQPPSDLASRPQVKWTSTFFDSYKDFASFFQTQWADIFMAPLVDNPFNRCKSPLKFLEYGALGAPGVFSCPGPYEEIVIPGKNGLLASTADEFKACLIRLIENNDLRFRLAVQAQETIKTDWLLSHQAWRWREIFQERLRIAIENRPAASTAGVVRSINRQMEDAWQNLSSQTAELEGRIQALNGRVSHLERDLAGARGVLMQRDLELGRLQSALGQRETEKDRLQQEILHYVLSASWRMTRPFRKGQKLVQKMTGAAHAQKMV
jgi:glycosyltransferase involved in cell wall biosynthesis